MFRYTLNRISRSIITLFVIITIVFLLLRLMPIEGYFAEAFDLLTDQQIEEQLRAMGLLDPVHVQLLNFYRDLFRGDLGRSIIIRRNVPITEIIAPKIPYSVYFGLVSIFLAVTIGVPLGLLMARFKGKFPDKFGLGYVAIVQSVPPPVYFLFLQIYVTSLLSLPMLFRADNPVSWIIPAICMSMGGIGTYAMWMRRFMLDEVNKDYVKLARAKGLKNTKVMMRHIIRNAFVPLSQQLPVHILMTIAGSIFVESLFGIPGMGGFLIQAIQRQDNTIVQALVLIYSTVGVMGLFLGDLLMGLFDPRIKLVKKEGAR